MDKQDCRFLKIAITPEEFFRGTAEAEIRRIEEILLRGEVDFVHVRHPRFTLDEMRNFLIAIPQNLRERITLHDHYLLALETPILAGGIHVNNRNREAFRKLLKNIQLQKEFRNDSHNVMQQNHSQYLENLRLSSSCHTLQELAQAEEDSSWDYVTLSPIFDSISKPGYTSRFNLADLSPILHSAKLRVVALGGVTPDKFHALKECGFSGAAMLSAYFDNSSFTQNN